MEPAVAASRCTTSTPAATVVSTSATTSTLSTTGRSSIITGSSERANEVSVAETTTVSDATARAQTRAPSGADQQPAAAVDTGDPAQSPTMAAKERTHRSSDNTAFDMHSDSTTHSSELSSQSGESVSSSDEYGDEFDESEDDAQPRAGSPPLFLLKPMPTLLPVCPMDDLAVEDAKRRRRHSRNCSLGSSNSPSSKAKHKTRTCADTECLPSPPSPLLLRPSTSTSSNSSQHTDTPGASSTGTNRVGAAPQLLRRDSMAIRHKYWKQLGLTVTRSDLERSSGRRHVRHKGLKVRLNDAPSARGASKSIFQVIASWYGASDTRRTDAASSDGEGDSESSGAASSSQVSGSRSSSSSSSGSDAPTRRGIRFHDEAELFYIPLHTDYSKRQRECMWHTRVEFIAMVERNLEAVYDEMEREYEEQLAAEARENDAMAREEARQRKVQAEQQARVQQQQQQQQQQKAAAAAAAAAAVRSPSLSPVTRAQQAAGGSSSNAPVPTLALCPIETQIKLAPRGRSPHDIRFKYLKHLGIKNKNS